MNCVLQILAYYTIYASDFFKDNIKTQPSQPTPEPAYAVIIDAGSTGSRVLALAFKKIPGNIRIF
jgi:hypothetical protein